MGLLDFGGVGGPKRGVALPWALGPRRIRPIQWERVARRMPTAFWFSLLGRLVKRWPSVPGLLSISSSVPGWRSGAERPLLRKALDLARIYFDSWSAQGLASSPGTLQASLRPLADAETLLLGQRRHKRHNHVLEGATQSK
jgi:hypothetical protein